MDVGAYIASITPDVRMRRILTNAATVDDTPASRCVMRGFLAMQLKSLVKARAPRMTEAVRAFVAAPEPKNLYRGLQAYLWLMEKIPEDQDRETLMLLGMQMYLTQEAKADNAREMVSFIAVDKVVR